VYQKICDLCIIQGGGKPNETTSQQPSSKRRTPSNDNSTKPAIQPTQPPISLMDMLQPKSRRASKPSESLVPNSNILYLAWKVIPNLRKLLQDQDRILTILSNAVYYIISPILKLRPGSKYSDKVPPALDLLCSMSRLPFAVKAWKKDVWDIFMDNKFFQMGGASCLKWKDVIQTLMVSGGEKEAKVMEVISKISAVASGSLFVSREQEILMRCYHVRRLSFLLWCGGMDQYVPQLPSVQEKLVEILKGPVGLMHVEAYLCLRVMMLRMSTHHLANLWPILLTEMVRLFGVYLRDASVEGSNNSKEGVNHEGEDWGVFGGSCKLLDMLLVLSTDEFHW
jgi:hypothetical protein